MVMQGIDDEYTDDEGDVIYIKCGGKQSTYRVSSIK
jgi:hypothetical protein